MHTATVLSVKTTWSLLQLFCHSTRLSQMTDRRQTTQCDNSWTLHDNGVLKYISEQAKQKNMLLTDITRCLLYTGWRRHNDSREALTSYIDRTASMIGSTCCSCAEVTLSIRDVPILIRIGSIRLKNRSIQSCSIFSYYFILFIICLRQHGS